MFPEMMLTGYPVEDLALRASFVEASVAALGRGRAAAGLGGIAVVVGYLDRRAALGPPGRAEQGMPPRCCMTARWRFGPSTTCPPTECSTSIATSCPAACCRSPAPPRAARRWTWPWPSAMSRRGGPVAVARTAGRYQRLAVRAGQGRPPADAVPAPGRRGQRPLAYANMTGEQDELVFNGDSIIVSATGAAGPRAAVRGGADRRRPGGRRCRPQPGGDRRRRRRHPDDHPPATTAGRGA